MKEGSANWSYITLISKKEAPTGPDGFRPISLVHGIQNNFSKILANRLQHRMHEIIDTAQTGFIKNRQITESFIYAQQILSRAKQGKVPIALYKANIKKAFDTLSWDFLLQTMRHLGFPDLWITWIQNAVLPGTSQVIINGLLGKKIILQRGVRQGDPLSPLLFILAMDFLARYFAKLAATDTVRLPFVDMKPCLLYADDALFFIKPEVQQLQTLQIVLTVFSKISGLVVNLQKSELLFSDPRQQDIAQLATVLGCRVSEFPFTYLGLPLSNKRLPKATYLPLIHRLNNRLAGWAAKNLSITGRIVLLNSVLSTLPSHFMMVLRLPKWYVIK